MLKELYDFEIPVKQLKMKKSDRMALQLYNYYYILKNYLVSFKKYLNQSYRLMYYNVKKYEKNRF